MWDVYSEACFNKKKTIYKWAKNMGFSLLALVKKREKTMTFLLSSSKQSYK